MTIRVNAKIVGNALNGFPRKLKELSPAAKKALREQAVKPTLDEIAAKARSFVAVSPGGRESRKAKNRPGPGELKSTIRVEMSATDAPVGYVLAGEGKLRRRSHATTAKGKARAAAKRARSRGTTQPLGAYAPVVEFGDRKRHRKPEPYIVPAKDMAKAAFQRRAEAALRSAIDRVDAKD